MALIKNAQAAQIAREAIVLDLGDLSRQGSVLVQQAREQAARIVEDAKRERERILAGAREEGRQQGFEKGLVEGQAKGATDGRAAAMLVREAALKAVESAWLAALDSFLAERDRMLTGVGHDVVRLAAMVAEKVAKRAVALDERAAEAQLGAVLEAVARPTSLLIRVHPDDRDTVTSALPALLAKFHAVRHAEIADDASLARGSCVASCREPDGERGGLGCGGEIDASIDTQVRRIVEALLPGTATARNKPEGGA